MERNYFRYGAVMLAAMLALAGCKGTDEQTKAAATKSGFSDAAATELAGMGLAPEEVASVGDAKKSGLDDASILLMVKSLHKQNLKFDIGTQLQILVRDGLGATALTQLVDMGAIPRWVDDIRGLKDANVGEVTILEMAKIRFQEKKEMLSGPEYGLLHSNGLSDAGLLMFARKGGNAQQIQQLRLQLALGKSEQEALKSIGM
ncbi:MAG: hypothetical protein ABIR47_18255 [Candidatus Kapaibacterium sp.]